MVDAVVQHGLWAAVTRLGEAQILLPAFAAGTLWLAFAPGASRRAGADGTPEADPPSRDSARAWVAGIVAATGLTTASKVAFLGFGIGSIALDFTGFSGHSMYAMAILPVLAALVAGARGAALGVLLALAVLVSRVELNAHSWSEAPRWPAGRSRATCAGRVPCGRPGGCRSAWPRGSRCCPGGRHPRTRTRWWWRCRSGWPTATSPTRGTNC